MKPKSYFTWLLPSVMIILQACGQSNINIPVEEFEKGISQDNAQVLDVRTQKEYNSGHLKNAFLADWMDRQTFQERVQYLDKNKPVYTYCLSGGRSQAAAEWLKEHGFKEVHNLDGGILAWRNDYKPVEGNQWTRQITAGEFVQTLPRDKTVLVDVGAAWCPPCKKMEPVLQDLQKGHPGTFKLVSVDGGEQEQLARELNADGFPTFIVYKEGKEVWRKQGVVSKEELLSQIN
jgi:rhodanese-related sulfurtransferase